VQTPLLFFFLPLLPSLEITFSKGAGGQRAVKASQHLASTFTPYSISFLAVINLADLSKWRCKWADGTGLLVPALLLKPVLHRLSPLECCVKYCLHVY